MGWRVHKPVRKLSKVIKFPSKKNIFVYKDARYFVPQYDKT
jgi:hypothetical protein